MNPKELLIIGVLLWLAFRPPSPGTTVVMRVDDPNYPAITGNVVQEEPFPGGWEWK